jgi:tetratricopeptide (TPR) repeat protein
MLLADLERLETAQLIRRTRPEPQLEYGFKHILVQETVFDTLLNKDRRRLHALVALTLEQFYSDSLEVPALVLAHHWDDAGETDRAFSYYLLAGENAARVYANAEALGAYERAHELARTQAFASERIGQLYASRGRVLELRGEYERALANYQEQEHLAQVSGDSALELDALIRRATLFVTPNKLFDLQKGSELCEQALRLARATRNRPAEAKVLWNLLLLYNFAGRFDEAIQYGEMSLALARASNVREQMAFTLNDLARPYAFTGRKEDAFRAQAEADALWRELGNLPMLADNLSNWGTYSFLFGDYQPSFPRVQEALRISREIGNEWGQAYASETLGFMYIELCELDQALAHFEEGAELAAKVGFLDAQCVGVAFSGLVYSELGVPEKGVSALEELVSNKTFAPEWLVAPYACLAMIRCEVGDVGGGKSALDAAEVAVQASQDPMAHMSLKLARAHWHLAVGQADMAYRYAVDMLEILETNDLHPFKSLGLYHRGRALVALGRHQEALTVLEAAQREAEATGRKAFLWEIQALLAELYRERGDTAQAEVFRQKARVGAQFIADHAPPQLRANFLNRPQVRQLFRSGIS